MLVMALFSINLVQAQCPPTGFAQPDTLYFIYDPATVDCSIRPLAVVAEGITFNRTTCTDELSIYVTSGANLTDTDNLSVDFGVPTGICEYSGGTLSAEEFEMIFKSMIKVYPNPITQGDNLNIKLGLNTSVKVSIYSVTGKQILATDTTNLDNLTVDISSLENGIYIAQIVTDLATITRKVIVMK